MNLKIAGPESQEPVAEKVLAMLFQHHADCVVRLRAGSEDELAGDLSRLDVPVTHAVHDEHGEHPHEQHECREPDVRAEV